MEGDHCEGGLLEDALVAALETSSRRYVDPSTTTSSVCVSAVELSAGSELSTSIEDVPAVELSAGSEVSTSIEVDAFRLLSPRVSNKDTIDSSVPPSWRRDLPA